MDNKIDFVIAWVDGSDESWQKEKNKYLVDKNCDNRKNRYRDWDNLIYWFRGVEKYAPWVNNIYFITYGHIPKWLNINHPKLKIINHKDYIPKEYLPTFNSHTIELNMHRIESLSEEFVYFNDDMFIIDNVKKEDFFKNNLPCDSAVLSLNIPHTYDDMTCISTNMMGIINNRFNKKNSISNNIFKWFNVKYGTKMLRTAYLNVWPRFCGIYETHIPNSFLKSTLRTVWESEKQILDSTSKDKFRNNKTHINQWIFRYWQLAEGNFYPRNINFGKYFDLGNEFEKSLDWISKRKSKIVCLNDTDEFIDFEQSKLKLKSAFETNLNQKSSFEL